MYRRIISFLKPHLKLFTVSVVCMIIFGATDGAVPFIIKFALDGVFSEKNTHLLVVLPIIIIGFAIVRGITDFGQQYLMGVVGHRVVQDLRNKMSNHLLSLGPEYFVKNSSGELLSRFSGDVVLVRTLVTDTVAALLRDSIRLIALAITALYLDAKLALIALVVFPLAGLPIVRIGKKIRKLSKIGQDTTGTISALLNESMLGNRVVKVFGREDFEAARFAQENEKLTRTLIRSERARALSGPINEVLGSLAISGVLLYGGYSVIGGDRTQGSFIAFLISVFLLYDPFKKISKVHATVQQGMAGAERVFELIDSKPSIVNPVDPKPLPDHFDLVLDNVSFCYQGDSGQRIDALTQISMNVPMGKKIALVGFSGAGKSTLVDLIPRFIAPTIGVVRLGGMDLADVDIKELRSKIAMVGQHTFLFNDSIFNNIRYGRLDATDDEIMQAAEAAFARDFIEKLPQGFNTVIGESGLTLSGGERQRIAISRAILKNAPILILDEATASLDNRSEREVQQALGSLEKGRTTIVVAHRLSTIKDADVIFVLSEGRVVESGKHDELLARQGEYAKLYSMQFVRSSEQ